MRNEFANLRFQRSQRGIVVWLVGDFVNQLAVNHIVVFINNDNRARRQAFQRAVCMDQGIHSGRYPHRRFAGILAHAG